MKKVILLIIPLLAACSSTRLVSTYKSPDTVLFDAYKVLVVGMTPNGEVREEFETSMAREFTEQGVEAVRSIDLFDVKFTDGARSEEELNLVEEQLLDKDFDAILFTRILGSENRQAFRVYAADMGNANNRFRDDYISSQRIYYDADYYEGYRVYFAETSLYCICVGKERDLIWRGTLEVKDPGNMQKAIHSYIRTIVRAMGDQDVIFRERAQEETR